MKRWLTAFFILTLMTTPAASVLAGANEKALEQADENAIFNRVGDWFATVGKSDAEREQILAQRKAERASKRAEKMARKKRAEAEKKMKKGKKDAKKMFGG